MLYPTLSHPLLSRLVYTSRLLFLTLPHPLLSRLLYISRLWYPTLPHSFLSRLLYTSRLLYPTLPHPFCPDYYTLPDCYTPPSLTPSVQIIIHFQIVIPHPPSPLLSRLLYTSRLLYPTLPHPLMSCIPSSLSPPSFHHQSFICAAFMKSRINIHGVHSNATYKHN